MIQISFQPALDPYHTIFRLLRLLPTIAFANRLEFDHVRILDFYLVFPFRIFSIRVKPEHRRFKRIAKNYESTKPYSDMPEDYIIFDRMKPIQTTAFQHLAALGFISPSQLEEGWITPAGVTLSGDLQERILRSNRQDEELMSVLKLLALDYRLSGAGGLKDRTHLLEHRYDAA